MVSEAQRVEGHIWPHTAPGPRTQESGLLSSTVRSPPTGWPAGLAEAGSWREVCLNSLEQRSGWGAHCYGRQVAGLSVLLLGFAGTELC